jgi:hypothetical protein
VAWQVMQADFREAAGVHDHVAVRIRDIETNVEVNPAGASVITARGQVVRWFYYLLGVLEYKGIRIVVTSMMGLRGRATHDHREEKMAIVSVTRRVSWHARRTCLCWSTRRSVYSQANFCDDQESLVSPTWIGAIKLALKDFRRSRLHGRIVAATARSISDQREHCRRLNRERSTFRYVGNSTCRSTLERRASAAARLISPPMHARG